MNKNFLLCILFFSTTAASYTVECNGWDSDTDEWVYGECTDGSFDGWNSDTGEWVWGDCEPGGSLDAWDSDTGEWVWGDCEEI